MLDFTLFHAPAANTKATVTKASAGINKNVCEGICVSIGSTSCIPSVVNLTIDLIDGSSGGTNYLWRQHISLAAGPGDAKNINITGLNIPGSSNTPMTLEFSAAGGANTVESVCLFGSIVS